MAEHTDHTGHHIRRSKWLFNSALAAGGISVAPYLLDDALASDVARTLHDMSGMAAGATAPATSTLVGGMQNIIAGIPLIGSTLTSAAPWNLPLIGTVTTGSIATVAATGILGIGGVLLSRWIEKHEDPNAKIKWSKIIRTAALVTSALIALPAILSGVGVGVAFFTYLLDAAIGTTLYAAVGGFISGSIGTVAMGGSAATAAAAALPHLFICGAAILPLGLAAFMGGKSNTQQQQHHIEVRQDHTAMQLVSAARTEEGKPCQLAFRMVDRATGKVLGPEDLTTTYTKKLHTMVVDHGLNDYHHLHPKYDAASGLFTCQFTPRTGQAYRAWHDFTRIGSDMPTHIKNEIPAGRAYEIPPSIQHTREASAEGVTIRIDSMTPLKAGKANILRISVSDDTGHIVRDLAPIMGASAHLAGFSKDGEHFIHCHPIAGGLGSGILQFHLAPEWAGHTKFFLQLNRAGREITIPFGQLIQSPDRFSERVSQGHTAHGASLA